MEVAKALVTAARSAGALPWPSVPAGPKYLVPVANRPILFRNLEALRAAGLLEATIAIGADEGREIARAVGDGSDWHLSVKYAASGPDDDLRATLAASRSFVADEPVLVQHGDAWLRDPLRHHIRAFAEEDVDVLALRVRPANGANALSLAYLLSPDAVAMVIDHEAGASDPLELVRESGGRVVVRDVDGCLPCHSGQDGLLEVNRRILEGLRSSVPEAATDDCEIQGEVVIDSTARLRRCVVRGPAIIGSECRLTDAYVGPFSSIGSRVVIDGSEIEYSIVLAGAQIRFVGVRLESSVIGAQRTGWPRVPDPERNADLDRRRRGGHTMTTQTRRSVRATALTLSVLMVGAAVAAFMHELATSEDSRAGAASTRIALREVDGGPSYYKRFPRSLPASPSFFPVGVWFESVTSQADIDIDKRAGLNTYVALTADSNLSLLAAGGMKAIAQYEEWATKADAPGSSAIAGWLLWDEVDMQMKARDGFEGCSRFAPGFPQVTAGSDSTITARA